MSEMKQRAEHVRKKKAAFGPDVNLAGFTHQGGAREYDPDYRRFSPEERSRLLTTGIGSPTRTTPSWVSRRLCLRLLDTARISATIP
jgi:hypothetical protein